MGAVVLSGAVESIHSSYSFLKEIIKDFSSLITKKVDEKDYIEMLLLAYYREVRNNINAISKFDLGKIRKENLNSISTRKLLESICIIIGKEIVNQKSNKNIKKVYEELKSIDMKSVEESNISKYYSNIIRIIEYTVDQIEYLNMISQYTKKEIELLKPIKIEIRIKNLNNRFRLIKRLLEKLNYIAN